MHRKKIFSAEKFGDIKKFMKKKSEPQINTTHFFILRIKQGDYSHIS